MKITERGWGGHFILGHRCLFRRNTLVEEGDIRIVVSTVGNLLYKGEVETVGHNRYYETMAFHAELDDGYWDANVQRTVAFNSKWSVSHCERMADEEANQMHDAVVAEIVLRIAKGDKFDDKIDV